MLNDDKKDDKKEWSFADEVRHELELPLDDRLVAFFAVTLQARMIGEDNIDLFPTFILMPQALTREEKIRLAEVIVRLGQQIRNDILFKRTDG